MRTKLRTKLIVLTTVIAALAIGVGGSQAALQNSVGVKLNFKKPGAAGSIQLQLINHDAGNGQAAPGEVDGNPFPIAKQPSAKSVLNVVNAGGLVPQPIRRLVVASTSAKYHSKAMPYCKVVSSAGRVGLPDNAHGDNTSDLVTPLPRGKNERSVLKNCPTSTIVGTGTFSAVIGKPGTHYDASQGRAITGDVVVYNYKPARGDQAGFVVLIRSENPVPNAYQYQYVGVNRKGTIDAKLPARSDIPPNISAAYGVDGGISMTSMDLKLTAKMPRAKKLKRKGPIFTIKSFKNLNVYGQLLRGSSAE